MRRIYFLILLLTSSTFVMSNPTGADIISGEASLSSQGNILNVTTSDKSIINWDSFSINPNETTNFIMPDCTSSVLNRVIGIDPSSLMGELNANGKLILINPNGIVVGENGSINVGSFIGSTFDILNEEFLKDGDIFFSGESNNAIINYGKISAATGDVLLIGYQVKNDGKINAENGVAGLAAGREIIIKPLGKERISIKPKITEKNDDTGVENNGIIKAIQAEIKADGNPYTFAIKNAGKVDALGVEHRNGRVYLVAENGRNETSGSISAKNSDDTGGEVHLLGKEVGLIDKAYIDVSGRYHGGEVYYGISSTDESPMSIAIFTSPNAAISADCIEKGNGGKVLLWGSEVNNFYGTITARGGRLEGDGGYIEVSSHKELNAHGFLNCSATTGISGLVLYDPDDAYNIEITAATANVAGDPNYYPTGSPATISAATIQTTLAAGTDVSVTTTTSPSGQGNEPGNITITNTIQWNANSTLTLTADNDITFNHVCERLGSHVKPSYVISAGRHIVIGDLSITNHNAGIFSISGNITVSAGTSQSGNITMQGGTSTVDNFPAAALIETDDGDCTITASGFISLTGGTSSSIEDANASIIGIGNTETITCSGNLTLQGGATQGSADITGSYTISCNDLSIIGGTGAASDANINALSGGNLNLTVGGALYMEAGSGASCDSYINAASGNFSGSISSSLSLIASAAATAYITSTAGNINFTRVGAVSLTGSGDNSAYINAATAGYDVLLGSNEVGYGALTMTGKSYISAPKDVKIYLAGASTMTGGNAATRLAEIKSTSNGEVLISNSSGLFSVIGGSNAAGVARITTAAGNLSLSSAGGITIKAAAAPAYLDIGTSGALTVSTTSGDITIGNASTSNANSYITNTLGTIAINTTTSGNVSILGGAGGTSHSYITATAGTITSNIQGSITLTSTANGYAYINTVNSGDIDFTHVGAMNLTGSGANEAKFEALVGNLFINSAQTGTYGAITMTNKSSMYGDTSIVGYFTGNSTLTGGSGATQAAAIYSDNGPITLTNTSGNVSLLGGSATDSEAQISIAGGDLGQTDNLALNLSSGNLVLTGNNACNAFISNTNAGTITLNVTGDINLTGGSGASLGNAFIYTLAGDITIAATSGSLALAAGSTGTAYITATTGNVAIEPVTNITLTGSSDIEAYINAATAEYDVLINSNGTGHGALTLTGKSSISAPKDVKIYLAGASTMTGGNAATRLAEIKSTSNGEVLISNSSGLFSIIGGSNAAGIARITAATGNLSLSSVGGITIKAAAAPAYLNIGTSGTLTVSTTSGDITIGNAATSNALSYIRNTSGAITVNTTTSGNVYIYGGAGGTSHSYITTIAGELNGSIVGNLTLTSSTAGEAYIKANVGNVDFSRVGAVSLSGSGNVSAYLDTSTAGYDVLINKGGTGYGALTMTGKSSISAPKDVKIYLAGASTMTGGSGANEIAEIYAGSASGSLTLNSLGDINLIGGAGAGSDAKIRTGTGNLHITASNDINLTSNTGTALLSVDTAGTLTAIAGNDININANSSVTNASGSIYLVCDNNNPTYPLFGNGRFLLGSGATLTATGGKVYIYTSEQSLNSFNSTINGETFSPSSGEEDTPNEKWMVYYPDLGPSPWGVFVIYYKEQLNNVLGHHLHDLNLLTAELFYLIDRRYNWISLDLFKVPRHKYIFENKKYEILHMPTQIIDTEEEPKTEIEQMKKQEETFYEKVKSYVEEKWNNILDFFNKK